MKNAPSTPRLSPLLALLALAALPGVAGAEDPVTPIATTLRPWPQGTDWGSAGAFGRFEVAQLTDVPGREIVGLRDGRVFLIADPSAFDGLQRLDDGLTGVRDFAVLRGGGAEGRDALVTVDPVNGLVRHAYDPLTCQFTSAALAGGAWQQVTRLASGDLDGDGQAFDVTGAAGELLVSVVHFASLYFPGVGHVAATPISDLAILDYDADGSPDVALLTAAGLDVIDATGAPFPFAYAYSAGGSLAVLPRATAPGDELVWCTRIGSTWYLVVLDAAGRNPVVPLLVAPTLGGAPQALDPVAFVPADLSQDGRVDLLVCHRTFPQVLVLRNVGTTDAAAFSNAEANLERIPLLLPSGGSMASNGATAAAFARAEPDEQDWIYYPADSDDGAFVVIHEPAPTVFLAGGTDLQPTFVHNPETYNYVDMDFSPPQDVAPALYNSVQIVVFAQCSEENPVGAQALSNQVYWFPSTPDPEERYRARVTLTTPPGTCPAPIYYMVMSLTHASSSGSYAVIDASYRLFPFALRYVDLTQDTLLAYLTSLPTVLASYTVQNNGAVGGTYIGGVVLLDEIPVFGGPPAVPRPAGGQTLTLLP